MNNLYNLLLVILLTCSCSSKTKRTSERSKSIARNHIYSKNITQIEKAVIEYELKNYRSDRIINKQHPAYSTYFHYKGVDHPPIEQSYLKRKILREYLHQDSMVHFAQVDNDGDSFTILTYNKIYIAKKISFLKTKLEILSIPTMIAKNKKIIVQKNFPMTQPVIDIDATIKVATRDYSSELDFIKELEPNTYQGYFPKKSQ